MMEDISESPFLTGPKPILDIDMGADFIKAFLSLPHGIKQWNAWVKAAFSSGLLFPSGESLNGEDPLIMLGLDFSGGDFRGLLLDEIDLSMSWLEGADFTGALLRGALIGCCPHAIFKEADLSSAILGGDISGTNFHGSSLAGSDLGSCFYQRSLPPIGLHPEFLAQCRQIPDEVAEPSGSLHVRPIVVRSRLILPPK